MLFREAVQTFNRMSETRKRLELVDLLSEMFSRAGTDLRALVYITQGKLGPDYLGIELGVADELIMAALSRISGTDMEHIQSEYAKYGDLGAVSKNLMGSKSQGSLFNEDISVSGLHEKLLSISKISGQGSVENRIRAIMGLLINSDPDEALYIIRIISGRLRLGVSDATILSGLVRAFGFEDRSEEIEESFNFHPDMGEIATLLQKGHVESVVRMGPTPMIPAKVMLAERLPEISDIIEKMDGSAAFEYKYDGMRTQIHLYKGEIRIFSRGSEETTRNFPDIIAAFKKTFRCESCILDGEAVPYNAETGELFPFQMASLRRGRIHEIDRVSKDVPLAVFLFDILYLDGRPVHGLPYSERRRILEGIFSENESFRLAKRLVTSSEKEASEFFEQAISDGCEGLVAKKVSPDSVYRAGARGWLWIKFKRDYQSEFNDSLDLVVIGAFYGHGRRSGKYGALLMGVYNSEDDTYESVCKLGTGFTDDILAAMPSMFSERIEKKKPVRVISEMEPDVWIYPSVVMEVIAAEITLSPIHRCAYGILKENAGLALRFPRFTGRFRGDKKPEDATSTREIIEIYKNQKKKS